MRKSSPRVLAGILLLALFASVGLMTTRAFSVNSVDPSITSATPANTSDANWNQTLKRNPTNFNP